MGNGTQNSPPGAETVAPQGHLKSSDRQAATELFNAILIRLHVTTQADAVQLFCGRATYTNLVDWRRGRHRVPQWAWEYLAAMLKARADDDLAVANRALKAPAVAPGLGSANNIAKWNARRAAEKAAGASKEKAGD